ncbi:MAG: hypothetical protein FWE87_01375 [Coriobacteriia bacterium]|nr:hypothetical protein [Coriobacteriia bacterium]
MKKLAILALVLLFVFSFAVVAGADSYPGGPAPFAGAQLVNPERADAPGYLAWSSALEQMDDVWNDPAQAEEFTWYLDEAAFGNPHGGYVTATTKCAVCHSLHRAIPKDFVGAGRTPIDPMLTGVGSACLNCHGTNGSVATNKPIEWPDDPSEKSAHQSGGCVMCHTGSVHGNTSSKYFGMNIYLLGDAFESDDNIAFEVAAGNLSDIGFTGVFLMEKGSAGYNDWRGASNSWTPVTNADTGDRASLAEMAAVKANAAGFTCSRSGCHNTSMYSVNYWGFADWRLTDGVNLVGATGHRTTPGVGSSLSMSSGASLNTMFAAGANPASGATPCGPCHPGQVGGGYRGNATLPAGGEAADRSRAYGCDQCHDMIGAKSGTTAWPHANGGISVIEWPAKTDSVDATLLGFADPVVSATAADGTNLWMYSGSALELPVAQSRFSFETWAPVVEPVGSVVDGRFTVIKDAIGVESNAGFAAGVTKDGACLKCHVPVDEISLTTIANRLFLSDDPFASEPAWTAGPAGVAKAGMHYSDIVIGGNPDPTTFGAEPTGVTTSPALIFTYR